MKILRRILERFHQRCADWLFTTFPGGQAGLEDEEDYPKIGRLDVLLETGSEGAVWILQEEGKTGYEGVHIIEAGDHLRIYNEDGAIVFDGEIIPDREIGKAERPGSLGFYQPTALGFWIHWTQQGWQPDDWADLFIRNEDKRLRAVLTKKEGV